MLLSVGDRREFDYLADFLDWYDQHYKDSLASVC